MNTTLFNVRYALYLPYYWPIKIDGSFIYTDEINSPTPSDHQHPACNVFLYGIFCELSCKPFAKSSSIFSSSADMVGVLDSK